MSLPLISKGNLIKDQLKGQVVLVTGGGGGIGFEACRSLLWLGATVVIAEIDHSKGKAAEKKLQLEFGKDNVVYHNIDIRNENDVKRLQGKIIKTFGKVDAIFNNATIAYTGAVHEVGLSNWDNSYQVNLRGPVLLTTYFLPDMLKRNSGTIVFVPSSGAAPYLGAYEVFKTAQVELCNTLAAELENSGIYVFSIGPGLVKTETADDAIRKIAKLYNKTIDEFYEMSENMILSVEESGAGFAAALTLADRYNGLEVSSMQALTDSGISIGEEHLDKELTFAQDKIVTLVDIFTSIKNTLEEQVIGWNQRPIFERQWVLRDFKKTTGKAPEYFLDNNKMFFDNLKANKLCQEDIEKVNLSVLSSYYKHQLELLKSYEKNPDKLKELTLVLEGWVDTIEAFMNLIEGP